MTVTITTLGVQWTSIVHGVRYAILISILGEIGFAEERISWFCDSHSAIQAVSKAGFRECIKHVDREYVKKAAIEFTRTSSRTGSRRH